MNTHAKNLIRSLLPDPVVSRLKRWLDSSRSKDRPKDLFSRIYVESLWGVGKDGFFSGSGSHDPIVVTPYVRAVRDYLASLPRPLVVVDIGCGDFNIGRQLVDGVDGYIACDIVPDLIERNRRLFRQKNLRFQVLDAIDDRLPRGDVVMIRQVLQHLTNAQVARIVRKLHRYRHWIITESLPADAHFEPNLDMASGASIRLYAGSGIVLTAPPFDVKPVHQQVLCEPPEYGGIVRTTAYSF